MESNRVVITGMGAVTPLGLTFPGTWENIINGVSGVGPITLFDASEFQVQIACEVKNLNIEDYFPAKEARRRDRFEQLACIAADQALLQSGLTAKDIDTARIGVIVSSAIGGLNVFQENVPLSTSNPRKVSPFAIPMLMANGGASLISIDHGFHGPSFSVASACASGADSIGIGKMLIKSGVIDFAVVGASEAVITPIGVACFDRIGAMSRRNDDFSMTPQPFDRNRDGLVMGEGAAIMVIERESSARKRGAEILAELAGYGATADAYHITAPSENGEGSAHAISLALESAGLNIQDVGYINAHGTATWLNDLAETKAIKNVFGQLAYNIPVSSTKSMTGHMMGATGALEALFCVQAIRDGLIPATIHYQTPDPECDLDYVPNKAREQKVHVALSNSFGFGGHNAVLVIREYF